MEMMSHFIYCFLLSSLGGAFSEKRQVDLSSMVLLFENATAFNPQNGVFLYINGENDPSLIAKWKSENGDNTVTWHKDNYTKIFMDAKRNIWIANMDANYTGKYYIKYSEKCDEKREVELTISEISRDSTTYRSQKDVAEGNSNAVTIMILLAVLFLTVVAVVYVCRYAIRRYRKKDTYQDIRRKSNKTEEQLFLDNQKRWTKYFVNVKWEKILPLLNRSQTQDLQDYCNNFKRENIIQLLNDDQQQHLMKYCEELNGKYPQLWRKHFDNWKWENIVQLLNDDQQQELHKFCEELNGKYPQLWRKHFDNCKWENIVQLLNGDQQQGLQKYCEELNGKYPQLWRKHFDILKWEDMKQMLTVAQQQDLQKYCDAEAEKIIDRDGGKMRQYLWKKKRKGDVYTLFYEGKPMDPNLLE